MLARCSSGALRGVEALPVTVEVDIAPGLPGLRMAEHQHPDSRTALTTTVKTSVQTREMLRELARRNYRNISQQLALVVDQAAAAEGITSQQQG